MGSATVRSFGCWLNLIRAGARLPSHWSIQASSCRQTSGYPFPNRGRSSVYSSTQPKHSVHLSGRCTSQSTHSPAFLIHSACIRGIHSSTACAAKVKKNAADFVKRITKDDVEYSFARSGGAGGQNVNKVNTKVDMRMNLDKATWLPDDMKFALLEQEGNRINNDGELVITSSRTRTQGGNIEDAMQKLQRILDTAALSVQPIEEDPVKRKKLAKQAKRANESRLQSKKMKSQKKGDRREGKRMDY